MNTPGLRYRMECLRHEPTTRIRVTIKPNSCPSPNSKQPAKIIQHAPKLVPQTVMYGQAKQEDWSTSLPVSRAAFSMFSRSRIRAVRWNGPEWSLRLGGMILSLWSLWLSSITIFVFPIQGYGSNWPKPLRRLKYLDPLSYCSNSSPSRNNSPLVFLIQVTMKQSSSHFETAVDGISACSFEHELLLLLED